MIGSWFLCGCVACVWSLSSLSLLIIVRESVVGGFLVGVCCFDMQVVCCCDCMMCEYGEVSACLVLCLGGAGRHLMGV